MRKSRPGLGLLNIGNFLPGIAGFWGREFLGKEGLSWRFSRRIGGLKMVLYFDACQAAYKA